MRVLRSITLVLALGLWGGLAEATTISWDFEQSTWPQFGPCCPNAIPSVILTENGNHFSRLTASTTDCGPSYFTTCPRTRAEVVIGNLTSVEGATRVYSIDIRFPSPAQAPAQAPSGHDSLVWQMVNPGGPELRTSWIGSQNGRVYLGNPIQPVPHTQYEVNLGNIQGPFATVQAIDLGPIDLGVWHTYKIVMIESTNPAVGRLMAYRDGVWIGTLANQATIRNLTYTEIYIDVVEAQGNMTGVADFDNASLATVPVAPTNLRVQ